MLLHHVVEFAAAARPDDTSLIAGQERWTFADLHDRVAAMAATIGSVTSPGDRVAIIADNHPAVVTALYSVPLARTIATFANTRHTPAEIATLLHDTEPTVVLASGAQLDRLVAVLPAVRSVRSVICIDGPHPCADADLAALLEPGTSPSTSDIDEDVDEDIDVDACAWLIHTSGTTGRAKGAMLTHRSLLAAVQNTAICRPMADDDVYLFPFPLFHVAAYNVVHSHLRRRPVVLMPRFDAAETLRLISSEQVTTCSLAPTMLSMLLDHPGRSPQDLATLRQISYGASAMPLDLLRRVLRELPDCGLAQGYGMTELSGNAVFLDPETHRRAAAHEEHLLAAAGRPGPLVALRIADDDGNELPPGSAGEILVRGDQVCAGYWLAPEATAESRVGPWLRTGDIGRIDREGFLYVVDRKKDLIISGGENVASREVEDVLSTHEAVGQVAVVGLADDRWGERICAVVVPAPGLEIEPAELVAWTDGRLAGFKRPRIVVVVGELPVNASGKIDKRLVRELVSGHDHAG